MPQFSLALKELMSEHRGSEEWKQADWAKFLNTNQSTLSEWLAGKKQPTIKNGVEIAEKLGCCVEYLYTRRGPKYPKGKAYNLPPSQCVVDEDILKVLMSNELWERLESYLNKATPSERITLLRDFYHIAKTLHSTK